MKSGWERGDMTIWNCYVAVRKERNQREIIFGSTAHRVIPTRNLCIASEVS